MTTDMNEHKAQLEEMLINLTTELKTLGIHNPEVSEDWIATPEGVSDGEADTNVSADRVESWDERRATLATLETRYNNVNRALSKIADRTYGVCEISGGPIEADRLDANPAARTCKAHMNDEANLST